MGDIKDDVANIASGLSNASPGVFVTKQVGRVGQAAVDVGKKVSAGVDSATDYVKSKFASKPAPTDIELPRDVKKKAGSTRSLRRR
jgi:hypothetical protein